MSRRRTLHPEEEELWNAVAKTARPMHSERLRRKPDQAKVLPQPLPGPAALPAFRIGEKTPPALTRPAPSAPIQMDARAFGKMKRGKLAPEARIDLHGMTLAEAHPALTAFVLNAQARGMRLVLVITGKGKPGRDSGPIPQRTGVLRQQVPHWLRQSPLSLAILEVSQAHLRHGGGGALYVYLRRRR
ncbi:MAG: Smr/MutS family protein [Pseudorhodobacter sp.]